MGKRGFTLPMVLVVVAGLLVLLAGLMTIVALERQTAKAHADAYRADLAARSALAEVKAVLFEATSNDEYVVFNAPVKVAFDDNGDGEVTPDEDVERLYPFLARVKREGAGLNHEYEPLFSAESKPEDTNELEVPGDAFLPDDEDERVAVRALPWEEAPVIGWRYVRDDTGAVVSRYAYWIEDAEAFLDPDLIASRESDANRERPNALWPDRWPTDWVNIFPEVSANYPPPWPAPGLNPEAGEDGEPLLGHVGIWTVNDGKSTADRVDFDDRLVEVGRYAPTRDSLLAAMEVPTPLRRDEDGSFIDAEPRQVEENFTRGNRGYEELPLVPAVEGIDPVMVGQPKLNLNALLAKERTTAVGEIANHITTALPEFGTARKGGFHEDYERTLAASMMDYADEDSDPTVEEGSYRGVDSYPMMNEVLVTVTGEWFTHPDDDDPPGAEDFEGRKIKRDNGRIYLYLTVELFVEVWNMSPHRIEGDLSASYDTDYSVLVGLMLAPGTSLRDPEILDRSALALDPNAAESGSVHQLEQGPDDRYYFPARKTVLEGNEHRVIRMGSVKYKLDVGLDDPDLWIPSPIDLTADRNPWAECRLRWNGGLVDWARELEHFGTIVALGSRETEKTLGSSYGVIGGFLNGNGDIRHSYYVKSSQNKSIFPGNYSPNRRNVRWATIYSRNPNTPWGRVLPSEWPDGGHDANFRKSTFKVTSDRRKRPDDDDFMNDPPLPEPAKAPSRISNLGVFFSETELGNIYDPAMWSKPGSGSQVEDWARELDSGVKPSETLGGGNTLRIGRAEHELFSPKDDPRPGVEAVRLLDLFHAGMPMSDDPQEREGELIERRGHVNINTAPRDVIRALVAGKHEADKLIALALGPHDRETLAPKVFSAGKLPINPPRQEVEADIVADAIIAGRPYASVSELANVIDQDSRRRVFGNLEFIPRGNKYHWSDPAAEESFARVYNSATVRSRNFRVHAVGQAVKDIGGGNYKVLSTRRKVFRVFSDPGERENDGTIGDDGAIIRTINEKAS